MGRFSGPKPGRRGGDGLLRVLLLLPPTASPDCRHEHRAPFGGGAIMLLDYVAQTLPAAQDAVRETVQAVLKLRGR